MSEQSLPLQLVVKTMVRQVVSCSPWWSRYPPEARGRDSTLEQVDA